jgi:four helix bundle protein
MIEKITSFTDLRAWQESHYLVLLTYKETRKFPKEELFSLTQQMQRAAVSITSNIAEGFGRHSYKERIQFYYLAQGSLTELKNQMMISRDIGYISKEKYIELMNQADEAHRILQALITKSKSFLPRNS